METKHYTFIHADLKPFSIGAILVLKLNVLKMSIFGVLALQPYSRIKHEISHFALYCVANKRYPAVIILVYLLHPQASSACNAIVEKHRRRRTYLSYLVLNTTLNAKNI